jgi:hypothetical protein
LAKVFDVVEDFRREKCLFEGMQEKEKVILLWQS